MTTRSFLVLSSLFLAALPTVAAAAPSPAAMNADDAAKTLKSDPDPQVKLKAAQRLGDLKDPKGVPALIETFYPAAGEEGKIWFVRKACVLSLAKIGKPAEAPVRKLLGDPDKWVRTNALKTLAKMTIPDKRDVLLKYMKADADEMVRINCMWELRDLKDKGALPALKEAAKSDPSPVAREKAAKVVEKLESGE